MLLHAPRKMDSKLVTGYNYGYTWAICSFVCFGCNNVLLGLFVPKHARKTQHHVWKWRNIANSFIHSSLSGFWALVCFWQSPELRDDLINNYTVSAHLVTAISVGYFFYDLLDMGVNDRQRSGDLLVHHFLVILCLGLSLCTRFYLGYALAALLVEVNSVFLHMRQLLLLQGVTKSSTLFRINGVLNLMTFFVFRILNMAGMIHWLWTHRTDLSSPVFCLGSFTMTVIMMMNIQLLMKIYKSDYSPRTLTRDSSNSSASSATHTGSPSGSASQLNINGSSHSESLPSIPMTSFKEVSKNGKFNHVTNSVNGSFLKTE